MPTPVVSSPPLIVLSTDGLTSILVGDSPNGAVRINMVAGALGTSTAAIGAVTINGQPITMTSTAVTLTSGTQVIGTVQIGSTGAVTINSQPITMTSTAVTLTSGTQVIGTVQIGSTGVVTLGTSTASIGLVSQASPPWSVTSTAVTLTSGTQTIGTVQIGSTGTVTLGTSTASVGLVSQASPPWSFTSSAVTLTSGTQVIGTVQIGSTGIVQLTTSTAAIGNVNAAITTPGVLSASGTNTSTSTLGKGATFTGTFEDVSGYSTINVSIFADVDSAFDGIWVQWSSDGTNVDIEDRSTFFATASPYEGRGIVIAPRSRYFRIVYNNGATAQGTFRLLTTYRVAGAATMSVPLDRYITAEMFALLTRAVVAGITDLGTIQTARISPYGAIRVAHERDEIVNMRRTMETASLVTLDRAGSRGGARDRHYIDADRAFTR